MTLLVVLLLVLMSVLPVWGYSRKWGLVPGAIVALVLAVLVVAILMKWM